MRWEGNIHMDHHKPPQRHDHRAIERDAADWLARRSDGGRPWTDADQTELDTWLAASTAHQVAFLRLEMVWQRSDRLKAIGAGLSHGEVPAKGEWLHVEQRGLLDEAAASAAAKGVTRPNPPSSAGHAGSDLANLRFKPRSDRQRRPQRARIAGIVATVAMMAVAGFGWLHYHALDERLQLATARGETETFPLTDGSIADLSAETHVDIAFSRRARSVVLAQGEAYFEVAKDPGRPFTVQVGDARVTAVGTRFAVRGQSDNVRIVVTEGTVRLEAGANAPRMPTALLQAGAIATVKNGIVQVESRSAEQASEMLGWRHGELVFRGTPLVEAVAEFNRFNTRQLRIEDPALAGLQIDGGFRADNADGFVRLLEQMLPVRAVQRTDHIELHER